LLGNEGSYTVGIKELSLLKTIMTMKSLTKESFEFSLPFSFKTIPPLISDIKVADMVT
jgi:hypothetical protein